ncbi:related to 3-methyladenine DNA glycosidase [Ramularia collo-cygni]|uniref:Related to 3-methyladenine DNA glycosidase n=1 Tax=Ramularia collo-cygni TaxID=112498 RepID=A0A2D3VBG6_9PEZI|nr:related to 3-methyladenine DNA glycosidase [Ramularia collo-cygni]CZT25433.1 related to 3-methyladenine DNA glycosidase [Ramularia collo-cygni]
MSLRRSARVRSIASAAVAQEDGQHESEHMPPTTTPNKRRKISKPTAVPPITPTPSAIAFMTNSSTTKPTPQPPATRPIKLHSTNAPLLTPGGSTQFYSIHEDNTSPSKAVPHTPPTTNKTLLSTACEHLISIDPTLEPIIKKHHCKPFSPEGLAEKIDPFRALASGIIAQQVSGAAASSIKAKFVALFSTEECANGFPTPKAVVGKPMQELRSAGLSQRKAEYIQGLAGRFNDGELTVKGLLEGKDEDVMRELVAVRGLGRWSVEMFMCFGLKRTDVFSTGDLGIQRGMAAHVGRDVGKLKGKGGKWKYMSEKEMEEIGEKFRPYRSLFMWYMWRVEDVDVTAVQDN